jgi:hypothetical protein
MVGDVVAVDEIATNFTRRARDARRILADLNVDDLAAAAAEGSPSATCHLHVRSPHA